MSVNIYRNGSLIRVAGIIESEIVTNIQVAIMPTASAAYKDKIFQYIGISTNDYINGFFYKCIEDDSTNPATYSWVYSRTCNDIFTGTLEQWNSLSTNEKIQYSQANITDM